MIRRGSAAYLQQPARRPRDPVWRGLLKTTSLVGGADAYTPWSDKSPPTYERFQDCTDR
jgi:hypothetical protein